MSTVKKGSEFEKFVEKLFDLLMGTTFIDSNIFTSTSEIDLFYRVDKQLQDDFEMNSRYLVIQCKNLKAKKAVSIQDVSHLICELFTRKSNLGLLFTTTHVSRNGKKRAKDFFSSDKIRIVEINMDDIKNIIEAKVDLKDLIIDKIEHDIILK